MTGYVHGARADARAERLRAERERPMARWDVPAARTDEQSTYGQSLLGPYVSPSLRLTEARWLTVRDLTIMAG